MSLGVPYSRNFREGLKYEGMSELDRPETLEKKKKNPNTLEVRLLGNRRKGTGGRTTLDDAGGRGGNKYLEGTSF